MYKYYIPLYFIRLVIMYYKTLKKHTQPWRSSLYCLAYCLSCYIWILPVQLALSLKILQMPLMQLFKISSQTLPLKQSKDFIYCIVWQNTKIWNADVLPSANLCWQKSFMAIKKSLCQSKVHCHVYGNWSSLSMVECQVDGRQWNCGQD